MAEALVSIVLDQLATIGHQQVGEGIKLITGAEQEVAKLQSNFLAIQAVLADAENKQMRNNAVRDWLYKLKDISYGIDDVLDEWNTKIQKLKAKKAEDAPEPLKKVCSLIFHYLSCRPLVSHYDIAVKIKDLDRKLDIIALEKERFNFSSIRNAGEELEREITTSFIDLTEVHGRDEDKKRIVDLLLNQRSQEQSLPIITIVGMGGIGKTTLAQLAFNDEQVKSHFDKKIWVCVSEPFDVIRIAKAILESLTNNHPNLSELETVLQNIRQHIEGKKFLLVLDDVWTENPRNWDQLKHSLKCGSLDSRILVTTRKENVANIIGTTNIISLGTLSKEKCWSLFSQIAFFGKDNQVCINLKDIGEKIVEKCKGLPLAIKILGSLSRSKTKIEEWQNILESDLWEIKEVEQGLFPPLLLSYYDLPPILQKCFSYCAIFSKDYIINKCELIRLWMAQDYLRTKENKDMQLVGQEYFKTLAMRSFFQDLTNYSYPNDEIYSCKMHDIIHDFAQFLTQNECFSIEVNGTTEFKLESSYNKVRHSLIKIKREALFPTSMYMEKSLLRTLVIECNYNKSKMVCSELFDQLTCLRSLVLSECSIEEVPIEIENLIHLRYINLCNNYKIKELPETLCGLYNLQILDVKNCLYLQKLPLGMGKLINLRELITRGTSISYMPESVERLTRLQTLCKFVVSDGSHGSNACSVERLKNFKDLRYFWIGGLGNLRDVSEVKEVELNNKKNLRQLILSFEGTMATEHEALLEALQPPSNLERLFLLNYRGNTVFPNWIMSLKNLKELQLTSCINCEHLPPLGKLSSLVYLQIQDLRSVTRVGNEFLGVESDATSSSSSSVIAFPKLKNLWFCNMNELKEWNYKITKRGDEDIIIMPHLLELGIQNCPKLKSLPNHLLQMTTLEKVTYNCPLEQELEITDNLSSSSPVLDYDLSNP